MLKAAINILIALVATPAIVSCIYLLLLTVLSWRVRPPKPPARDIKFDIIVPAHNEEAGIQRTVESLKRIDWPADRFRVIVVADNCNDATASLAQEAGAIAIERHSEIQRGKGYALVHGFESSRNNNWADAVVVIDADAEVSINLLSAFAARIELGELAMQAHYGVLNPNASWRTRLLTIAKASFHIVRSRARERLGVSCGIRGNGWCVTHTLLERMPYEYFSLTEDLEYGIALGLAGYRVAYCDEAHANADMVVGEQIASKQRRRWEDGRFELIRTKTATLLRAAIKQKSKICFDLAMDLLVLPLSYVALNVLALTAVSIISTWLFGITHTWQLIAYACTASIAAYVLRGWALSNIGAQGLIDLIRVPRFLLWKILLMTKRNQSKGWVRTERERK